MNNVDSNRQPKKLRNCCNCNVLVLAGMLMLVPAYSTAAEDLAVPPKAGEQTQVDEAVSVPLPELPRESDDSRNIPQPEVTIIHRKDMRVEEYRVNGKLRYVKITPRKGKPYYLVDRDGDGSLEYRYDDLDGVPPVNEWILLEW